jgi:hypothetical protein
MAGGFLRTLGFELRLLHAPRRTGFFPRSRKKLSGNCRENGLGELLLGVNG